MKLAAIVLCCAAGASVAHAQPVCGSVSTSLLQGFRAIGNPGVGDTQPAGAAWTFRRSSPSGLLDVGYTIGGWSAGGWANPDQPFGVPIVGPVYSNDPLQNQVNFYYRLPSFTSVFMHPGYGSIDSVAVFAPQSTVTLSAATLRAELLGGNSNGAVVSVVAEISAIPTTLVMPTLVPYTTTGSMTMNAANLPLTLHPGDRVYIRVSNNGDPAEDWFTCDLTMTIAGGPVVLGPPRETIYCVGGRATIRVDAAGSDLQFQWQRFDTGSGMWVNVQDITYADGTVVTGSQTANLHGAGIGRYSAGDYRVVVSNSCGTVTTPAASLHPCSSDFNCDGFVDDADFSIFSVSYDLLICEDPAMPALCPCDINNDGVVDDVDFTLFAVAYDRLLCS
ncbi:MAG: hypothetical protein K2Y21_11315 [Phycisphaerales bacterium]|nr:hypothetical protein [Phycisphaerales bacterium]